MSCGYNPMAKQVIELAKQKGARHDPGYQSDLSVYRDGEPDSLGRTSAGKISSFIRPMRISIIASRMCAITKKF